MALTLTLSRSKRTYSRPVLESCVTDIDSLDQRSLKPAYETSEFPDHGLSAGRGKKIYTGSCHCGKVKVAFEFDPLPKSRVVECNCSICRLVCENHNSFIEPAVPCCLVIWRECASRAG